MTKEQINKVLAFDADTFKSVTGGADADHIPEFCEWILSNAESLKWSWNHLTTLGDLWCEFIEPESDQVITNQPAGLKVESDQAKSGGMTVEESKAYLAERGLDSLVLGGFETIKAMQQGR
jgi:hypothetical protein